MKLFKIALLLLAMNTLQAQDLSTEITLQKKWMTVGEILETIQQKTNINFSYDPDKIPLKEKIQSNGKKESIKQILDASFSKLSIHYSIVGKTVVLQKKSTSEKNDKRDRASGKELRGKIIDDKTKEPLSFATIRFKGTSKGMVSNEEGEFNLKLTESETNATLIISFIGYSNREVAVSAFGEKRLTIALEENVINLLEVEVTPKKPLEIIGEALSKITENYRTEKYAYNRVFIK